MYIIRVSSDYDTNRKELRKRERRSEIKDTSIEVRLGEKVTKVRYNLGRSL